MELRRRESRKDGSKGSKGRKEGNQGKTKVRKILIRWKKLIKSYTVNITYLVET